MSLDFAQTLTPRSILFLKFLARLFYPLVLQTKLEALFLDIFFDKNFIITTSNIIPIIP